VPCKKIFTRVPIWPIPKSIETGAHTMKILVEVKEVYGNKTVYPACDTSKSFAALAGTKTLTHAALCIIERMGYAIELKPQTFKI